MVKKFTLRCANIYAPPLATSLQTLRKVYKGVAPAFMAVVFQFVKCGPIALYLNPPL